jgi:hypothetical protein
MRNLLLLASLALIASALYAADRPADFRAVNWGMSVADVKKAEAAKLQEEKDGELIFETHIAGEPVVIHYRFDAGKLASAEYDFVQQYRETERYVEAFDVLQNQLEKKYGAPLANVQRCDDSFYADYPRRWGTGIVVGKLTRDANWKREKLLISHSIRALPGGIVGHAVEYQPARDIRSDLQSAEILGAL